LHPGWTRDRRFRPWNPLEQELAGEQLEQHLVDVQNL
jgi:hypothetical protein